MKSSGATKFGSLKTELAVLSAMLVLAMSGSTGLTAAWIYDQALADDRLKETAAAARLAAALRPHEAPESVARKMEMAGFSLILAADGAGRVVWQAGEPDARAQSALRAAVSDGAESVFLSRAPQGAERATAAAPVVRDNLRAGAVAVRGEMAARGRAAASVALWLTAALGLNILMMGLFMAFFVNRRLVRPFRELAADLALLAGDRFTPRPRPSVAREMDELFASFDRAALELMNSRRRLETQLHTIRRTQAHLAASEKMAAVGRLASGLAHELGNPIGALMGFNQLLAKPNLSESDREAILTQSAHELKRMDGSLKELLRFSRPSRPEAEPVEVSEVIASAVSLARPQKWAAGVIIAADTEEGLTVMAERNSLLQVLLNLLANACQALGPQAEDRRVKIEARRAAETVEITVADNGPGVDPADLPRLFEPYFTTKEPGRGTGLGLAVSLSLINGFGGTLSYTPGPEGGARFTITLPARAGEA